MTAPPKALALADDLDRAATIVDMGRPPEKRSTPRQAAAELRSLHAVNAELLEALGRVVARRDATKQRVAIDLDIAINAARAAIARAQGSET